MRTPSVFLFIFLCQLPGSFGQVPTNGLVAHWPFNGNFQDEGPSHLYSYPHGGVSLAEDRFGNPKGALSIDSIHSCLVTPDHPALHIHSFSWSFWLRVEKPIVPYTAIICKRREKFEDRASMVVYSRDCSLNSYVCNHLGAESFVRSSLWIPQLNTWHHIAVTGDYLTLNYFIYADGTQIGRVDLNVAPTYDGGPLAFGNEMFFNGYSPQTFLDGRLDDIRLYNRGLTPEEVLSLAAERPERKPRGTDWEKRDLPDGKYVALYTEHDRISPQPFWFELKSRRPLWQNAWFIAGCLLLTTLLTFWALRVRHARAARVRQSELEKFKAVEQERSRIARDLHDDLGSGLSAIGLLTEIARQRSGDAGLDSEIQKMAATSTELSRKIREIIWMVSARFDNLENLVSYLNHFAAELFADGPTELEVHLPPKIPALALGGEQRRAFFHAVKTALLHLHQQGSPRVVLAFSASSPFEATLRCPLPDTFSQELENPTAFSLAVQKLKEAGGDFHFQKDESVYLRFVLYTVVK